jgi:hypothetical protein
VEWIINPTDVISKVTNIIRASPLRVGLFLWLKWCCHHLYSLYELALSATIVRVNRFYEKSFSWSCFSTLFSTGASPKHAFRKGG